MAASPPPGNNAHWPSAPARGRRTLVEAELVASVAWLVRLRWLAGAGVLFVTWTLGSIFKLQAPFGMLYAIGASILLYNLVIFLLERRLKRTSAKAEPFRRLAMVQMGLDWLAMTLLIHFSGGIESPAIFFFIFHIIIASIFFPQRDAFAFSILAVALPSATALLEYFSILPHRPMVGFLEVPLFQNGLYVAAILLFFGSTGLIAAYLATTIYERLRQREEEVVMLTESLQRATTRLQVLNEGARTVNSTLELTQVLNRLVKSTTEVMEVRACSIRLLDSTGRRLEPVATYGLSQAYLDKGPVDLENNPLARLVLGGKVINIPNISQSSLLQYPEWAVQEGISSLLSAPLIGKNGPQGILRAYAEEKDHFTSDDEAFLAAIAAQGSIAIDNAIAYQAIATLDATKSTFIRMVTHELRSPVSVTRSLLRTITAGYTGDVNEQQRDILERASRRIDFLQKLIDDLLDLAASKVVMKTNEITGPVAVDEIVQKVVRRFEVSAQEKQLTLEYAHSPEWRDEVETADGISDPVYIMATAEGLDRVFNNLVSNAVKYTPAGGKVTVALSQVGKEAQVTVEDTGIGIPEEAMAHLFEEFYRAPNAKEIEREGTGLGLTIVKDIVTRFGGHIAVESTLGVGTLFKVTLPLAEKADS